MLFLFSCFFLLPSAVLTQKPSLSSTQTERGVCLDDVIVFTCTVTEAFVLEWAIDSLFAFGTEVKFTYVDELGSEVQSPSLDVFNITLLAVERDESQYLANFTSELALRVTQSTLEKHVRCGNEQIESSIVIKRRLAPHIDVIETSAVYGIAQYTLELQLEIQSDKCVAVSLYHFNNILSNFTTNNVTLEIHNLNYSCEYSFYASVANCFNENTNTTMEIMEAGCRAPLSPVNGSIEEYNSTEEGAEIQFHCHDGYTPNEMMSSQCLNSSWSRDPMELVCNSSNIIQCDSPVNHSSMVVMFNSTNVGSIATYKCYSSEIHITECMEDERWLPDPSDFTCHKTDKNNASEYSTESEGATTDIHENSHVLEDKDTQLRPEIITVIILISVLVVLAIVTVSGVFYYCVKDSGAKRKKHSVDNEYTEKPTVTSLQPSGTTAGGMATSSTVDYQHIDSDSTGQNFTIQSTTRDSPQYQEPTPVFRPESPEGTPPPVPPYRGSPEPLTSLPTIPLSPNSHHSLLKTTPPEMIATYVNCTNGGCSKLPQKDPSPSLPSYENTPLPPRRDGLERYENHVTADPQLQETTPAATHSLSLPPDPSPPILPPRAQTKESQKRLVYTDVVPKKTSRGRHGTSPLPPPTSISVGGDTVVYSEVRTNVKVKVTPRVNKYDRLVTLENIMLQIKPLAHRWFDFAAFLELQGLGVQDNHYHSEEKTLELIINRWMIRIGRTPTWQEVAGLVKYSGFPQLADAISGVYVTGQLPTPINMDEENTQQEVPLPLQMMNGDYSQSGDDDDDVTPPSPPPPPRPPRGSRAGPAAKDKIPVG